MRTKRVLIYGPGNAREHATYRALKQGGRNSVDVLALIKNRNALLEMAPGVRVVDGLSMALEIASEYRPDLVLVTSPNELIAGDADIFRSHEHATFGVSAQAAQLEASKIFSKKFMQRHHIPTPNYYVAKHIDEAESYLKLNWDRSRAGYVLKTDRFSMNAYDRTDTPEDLDAAISAARRLFKSSPDNNLVLEERITGYELSLHVLVDKDKYYILPPVQDYKKLLPNNEGAMTHGVVAVATSQPYPITLYQKLCQSIIEPTLEGLSKDGILYQSILYIGLMITNDGPFVLEYNVRSGNPEWLSLLGLLQGSLVEVFDSFKDQSSKALEQCWKQDHFCVTAFGLAAGYPETARKGYAEQISGLDQSLQGVDIFGESIIRDLEGLRPSGGRIFAIRAGDADFSTVQTKIKSSFDKIRMNGLFYRDDFAPICFN